MFGRLRRKFVLMHMATVFVLFALIIAAILSFTNASSNRNSSMILDRIIDNMVNGPKGPNDFKRPDFRNMGERDVPKEEHEMFPVFQITADEEFNIINARGAFDMNEDFYSQLALCVKAVGKEDGSFTYDNKFFRFKLVKSDGEVKIAVLDNSKERRTLTALIRNFIFLLIPILIILFIISWIFVKKATKPVEEAFAKQKEFIADASHELKTPLTVIQTNTDVLADSATFEQSKWINYIKKETGKMAELVNSLLYLARIENSREELTFMPFDLSKLAEDTLMPLEAVFFEKNISFESDIQPDIFFRGDRERIARLIGILIDNAVKYSDGTVKFSLSKNQNSIIMEVFNTGIGIAKDDLEKIFDRFYRADKARELSGSYGLGLPIASAVVKSHGGKINVESEYGKWVRFIVTFKHNKNKKY